MNSSSSRVWWIFGTAVTLTLAVIGFTINKVMSNADRISRLEERTTIITGVIVDLKGLTGLPIIVTRLDKTVESLGIQIEQLKTAVTRLQVLTEQGKGTGT